MNDRCKVPSIVQDHVQRLVSRERSEGLLDTPQILLLSLSFPCEDRNASGSNAISGE